MNDIKACISKNIVELRKNAGMTQLELAEKLNYSDKAISKWERGESIPDIVVLKDIADLFAVTVDYLIAEDHPAPQPAGRTLRQKIREHGFITGMSIALVWLVATVVFVIMDLAPIQTNLHWMAFVYAVPVTLVVWLVFNAIWFDARRNYLIISLLMWCSLAVVYFTFLAFGYQYWLLFVMGIPGQLIVWLWARMKVKKEDKLEDK